MQQATLNTRHDNYTTVFSDQYMLAQEKEETSFGNSQDYSRFYTIGDGAADWEFFCNELEYE